MNKNYTKALGDLELPEALPAAEYDLINMKVARLAEQHKAKWHTFTSAWNAIAYRWLAANEHAASFEASIALSSSPIMRERYRQDHDLFVFCNAANSAIECFYFAAYCFGALISPVDFPLEEKKDLNFKPDAVLRKFQRLYPADTITDSLSNCLTATERINLHDLRIVLYHRGSPPRLVSSDGPAAIPVNSKDLASDWTYMFMLEPGCLRPYTSFVDEKLNQLIKDLASFVAKQLP